MKKLALIFIAMLGIAHMIYAQVPETFNYQAVARDAEGELITNTNINFQLSILEGAPTGPVAFTETQLVKSNSFGVCIIKVGEGDDATGSLLDIDWGSNKYFLNIAVDITGATSFKDMGTVELLSVPYALYAKNAGEIENDVLYFPESDTLFAVKDRDGNIVFAVFPNGARVYVNEGVKGPVGGFAVTGRNPGKAVIEEDYILVTPDSTRVWVNEEVKGKVGGFAVTGRNPAKGMSGDYFVVTSDSARIYINDTTATKGKVGGFAVTGRNPRKGPQDDYLRVTRDSTRIYIEESGSKGPVGGFAVTGRNPGKGDITKDYFNISGNQDVETVNSEARILWYPKKEAFLTGRVLIEGPDSVGFNSMATGFESKAKGMYSQAMGYKAIARGNYSTAIGDSAVALGTSSFSFGDQTFARGDGSYAFGKGSVASGTGSYAFGLECLSSGTGAISMGTDNTSTADYSFSAGRSSDATKTGATALGHLVTSSGDYSTALGYNTTSSNLGSTALGYSSLASNSYATALGYSTTASGSGSTALGFSTSASASYSSALGYGTIASGYCSIAMGVNSESTGNYSIALGYNSHTNLNRANSTAIGYQCNTYSGESFAAGSGASAGNSGLAYGMAYAIGYNVSATGGNSLCLGAESSASGLRTRSIGYHCQAIANYSSAIGYYNDAYGQYSTAMGYHTQANTMYEFVVGAGNELASNNPTSWVATDPIFVVGNSPNASARSNALTILKNGNVGIGTSAPGTKLSIVGLTGTTSGSYLRVYNNNIYYYSSSRDTKTDIQPLNDDFNKILLAKPVSFTDKVSGEENIGFIAEDFNELGLNNLVIYENGKPKSLSYELVSIYNLEIIKEQQKRIKSQDEKISDLEERILVLEQLLIDK